LTPRSARKVASLSRPRSGRRSACTQATGSGSLVEDGEVKLVTAQSLMFAVWANNHGGDAGDSVADVRMERRTDQDRDAAKWTRIDAAAARESRSEDEIESGLLTALGLR